LFIFKARKKDLTTGLSTSYNWFLLESISLVGDSDQSILTEEVPIDSKFAIVFEGIANHQLKDEKAFLGLSLLVTDAKGMSISKEADLFASSTDGYSSEDASVLRATFTVGSPMEAGQTYHCKVLVFDKNKAEFEIVSD
jgi:hypothetical protein